MAIVSKMTRCAACGSTAVTYSEGTKLYRCADCGAERPDSMPAADLAHWATPKASWTSCAAAIPIWTSPAGAARTACRWADIQIPYPSQTKKNRRRRFFFVIGALFKGRF